MRERLRIGLTNARVAVVVPHERVERTERGPASAQRLGGVAAETADVAADHAHLEEGGEVEHALDAVAVLIPLAEVVAEPFADLQNVSDVQLKDEC